MSVGDKTSNCRFFGAEICYDAIENKCFWCHLKGVYNHVILVPIFLSVGLSERKLIGTLVNVGIRNPLTRASFASLPCKNATPPSGISDGTVVVVVVGLARGNSWKEGIS